MEYRVKSEMRDGMRIDWDVPIPMDDGIGLRADVFRPIAEGKYPVIMTYGPYGKWAAFRGSVHGSMATDVRGAPGRAVRLDQQVSMLGGGRP